MIQGLKVSFISERKILAEKERVMIFTMRKSDVRKISKELRELVETLLGGTLLTYHADMDQRERSQMHEAWNKTDSSKMIVMVCTNAFGTGTHCSGVRLVYHFGGSYSLLHYIQETGRGGRDGMVTKCFVLWNSKFAGIQNNIRRFALTGAKSLTERDTLERKWLWWTQFESWVLDCTRCRRSSLYYFFDGIVSDICLHVNSNVMCDAMCDACREIAGRNLTQKESVSLPMIEQVTPEKQNLEMHCVKSRFMDGAQVDKMVLDDCELYNVECVTTTTANLLQNQFEDRSRTDILISYRENSRRFAGLCIPCLILKDVEIAEKENGKCEKCLERIGICFRCHASTHQLKDCKVRKWYPSHCPKCGLNRIDGENAHPNGKFGRSCTNPRLNHIFWTLWWSDQRRRDIMENVMTEEEKRDFERSMSNEQIDGEAMIEKLTAWLHNKTGIPLHIRIFCEWAQKRSYGKQ